MQPRAEMTQQPDPPRASADLSEGFLLFGRNCHREAGHARTTHIVCQVQVESDQRGGSNHIRRERIGDTGRERLIGLRPLEILSHLC